MRTLIVSDLHLGTHTQADVLRRPAGLAALLGALDGVDRLVLLGDVLELRSGPVAQALAAARPVLEAVGARLAGRPVVIVPGNHDHALIAPWLERSEVELGVSQSAAPVDASWTAGAVAGFLGGPVSLAYPGLWVRDDVFATHGHYLDCHVTVPTIERIAIGATGRVAGAPAGGPWSVSEHEALVAPVYAWLHAMAQGARVGAVNGAGSARAWRALSAPGGGRPLRARALGAAFPVVVAALNRAGLGPLRSDLSGDALRRGRLDAMGVVVSRLGIGARHVVFGHTHRAGPLAGDSLGEWSAGSGVTRLVNCGSWVLETQMMTRAAAASPYWPGGCVVVDDDGPPRLERLLGVEVL